MRFGRLPKGQQAPDAQRLNLRQSQVRPPEPDAPNQVLPPRNPGGGGEFDGELPLPESLVSFDDEEGHDHTGADGTGKPIAHSSLTTPGSALLDGSRHSDTASGSPTAGDLIYANATPAWAKLALGAAGRLLKVVGGAPAWSTFGHSELSGTGSALLDGSQHSDTAAGSVTRGDLIYGNSTPRWARLALGAANRVLKSDGTDAAWGQVAHAELTGVGADDHHNQAHSLTGADHTLSGATAGHLLAATSATAFALQAPGTQVIRAGVLASRPAATAVPDGTLYLATDDNGGTLYRSNGTTWVQCGGSVNASAGTTGQMYVGTWVNTNVGALTTSATRDRLASGLFFGASTQHPEDPGRSGTITLLVASLSSAVSGGGSVTIELFRDTGSGMAATGVTGTISSGSDSAQFSVSQAVSAGDLLEIRANRSGTVGSANLSVRVYLTPS